eukprot:5059057-Prymnesium_polylepis.1
MQTCSAGGGAVEGGKVIGGHLAAPTVENLADVVVGAGAVRAQGHTDARAVVVRVFVRVGDGALARVRTCAAHGVAAVALTVGCRARRHS